ncbi:hypothetical protein BDR26DRAFT_923348 [Obelidium mucronatum]|nr:hypothetical protein BDR26DRAFT_923348 [Obelidium mucronatum]
MSDMMDMSLDEIAAKDKTTRVYSERGSGASYKRGSNNNRRGGGFNNNNRRDRDRDRGTPYSNQQRSFDEPWRHDKYDGKDMDLREKIGGAKRRDARGGGGGGGGARDGSGSQAAAAFARRTLGGFGGLGGGLSAARAVEPAAASAAARVVPSEPTIRVLNLDPKASAADVQATFSDFGSVVKCLVSYDAASHTGIAEISFKERMAVKSAIDTYNGVVADGRTLKVEEVAPPASRGLQIAGRNAAAAASNYCSCFKYISRFSGCWWNVQ